MADKVLSALLSKDASIQAIRMEAGAHRVEDVIQILNTQALFGGFSALYFDGVQQLKKDEAETLLKYLIHPSHSSFLVLGSSTPKALGDLYLKAKKEMVVLDLSDEKPWERQRRLGEWLSQEAKKEGKSITPDAAAYLLEHVGLDMPGLYQELAKLACFVGEKTLIQRADVEKICTSRAELTFWQLAEKVVWGKENVRKDQKEELSFVLPFIGALRYQLQTGLQLATLSSPQEMSKQLRPQALDKYLPIVKQRKAGYFLRGLQALFELELAAKSTGVDLGVLFDRFIAALKHENTHPSS